MFKRFVVTFIISAAFIYLILITKFDNVLTMINILDSIFVVGIVMVSVGILISTNITQIFQGFTYAFRTMFLKRSKHLSFYDYKNSKNNDQDKSSGIPMLFIGGLYFIGTVIMAYINYL